NMTERSRYDVAIVGGGMVGMTLALALARKNISVALIEKGAMPAQLDPAFDGRVSAIALGSQRVLESVGAWQHMAREAQPILDIRVSDGQAPFFLHYDHKEVGEAPFGHIVENRHIRYGLQQVAKELSTLSIFENNEAKHFAADAGGVTLQLKDHDLR